MQCPHHKKDMRLSAGFGYSCPTPVKKSEDGKAVLEWCSYKPGENDETNASDLSPASAYESMPITKQFFNGRELDDLPKDIELDLQQAPIGRLLVVRKVCAEWRTLCSRRVIGQKQYVLTFPCYRKLMDEIEGDAKQHALKAA